MSATPDNCDVLFRNGTVIDGTGAARRQADVAVSGERIVAVGDLARTKGGVEIEAGGRIVAPGFIDAHTHDDRALLVEPLMAMKVSQGVTTVVVGNCGVSLAPLVLDRPPPPPLDLVGDQASYRYARFADYLDQLDREPPAVNAVALAGHSTLRVAALDRLERAATSAEIRAMTARLEDCLAAGAIGLSTGLYYPPAMSAPTAEVIDLASVLRGYGALYATHMRDEGDRVMAALEESFEIARTAGVPAVISHHKVAGKANHGRTRETLAYFEAVRGRQPVALDVYPYAASSTVLSPDRLDEDTRVIVTWSKARPEASGRDLDQLAAEMGVSRRAAASRLLPAGAIYFTMDEDDVRRVLSYPHAMIGSDGLPHDAHPHPRLWGTFPRVLGHYSREVGLFPLEEAVRRMTGLPAQRFGLKDRGAIRAGAFADLVVFDPVQVIDRATFERPREPAAGIDLVMVNGRIAWRQGASTGARAGRMLRRQHLDRPMSAEAVGGPV